MYKALYQNDQKSVEKVQYPRFSIESLKKDDIKYL